MAGYNPQKAKIYNEAIAQGLTEDQAFAAAGITESEFGNYEINDVAGSPTRGQLTNSGFNIPGRTGSTLTKEEMAEDPEIETTRPTRTVPVSSSSTTTTQETVTGGTETVTRVTPTTYKDTPQSTVLTAEADSLAAQKEQRAAALRAEGKTGGEILRDPEYRKLSQQQQTKQTEAENAKAVDQAGTVTTTTAPGSGGTVSETTVDGNYLTTRTSGDDPTAAAGQTNQFVAASGPVQSTNANTTLANYTTTYNPETCNYDIVNGDTGQVVDSGLTEQQATINAQNLSAGGEGFNYDSKTGFVDQGGLYVSPEDIPVERQGDELVNLNTGETLGIDPETGFVNQGGLYVSPEEIDGANDPYAQLVDETEAEGGLVEFTNDGPVGVDSQSLAAQQANMQATLANARAQAALKAQRKQADDGDWRVKLRLAPGSNYLYRANDGSGGQAGILQPLLDTDGVIFPYTPQINTNYKATYNSYDLTHSNYRGYFYQGSAIEEINITATFTAQDTYEAQYLLAVIHFFRSITKMFYGKDTNAGTPPPLVFLQGLGEYQFNLHPCVVSQFTYNLPNDVDYIRARSPNQANLPAGLLQRRNRQTVATNPFEAAWNRLKAAGVPKGGMNQTPAPAALGTKSPTYVPTKIDLQISLLPVQSRSQVSNNFSLQKYANGDLLKGGFW